ncbi:MAG: hypothetical protein COW24_01715 [Candidatus Kerfeldbacteria bacterium CG15_BIG_FIL_POST_REV_8_21_14_020_45_12]|uniref:Uncharacterized protein n=1 Tax=Candidatus Kerfeldbacteria bacterium CG15_BIG_FIL_POST_REV_8_21_14_020_45_12 TaxID=2014247 RepID=A0A2M7H4J9_9BACT|nr:MAG: hypothetical protein COW24_01715 [Candidatus Kerfeldbacteria bacterium CG15_BIG_FIL_POST_REV_8_21_14_020_45_12]PJA92916.1 MAG: hypothetical protein CO132_05400 [Candidatus Kerfeldbacteria bacterium CG_4_9_14_3_um_filter_45_8]
MTLKRYLLTMGLTTLICWVAFIVVLFRIDPDTGGTIGLLLFFTSMFFAAWGTLSLIGFLVRFLLFRNTVPFRYIGTSLRQALWFATLLCLTLFLVSQELLSWWMTILLIIGLCVLEAFFLARSLEARYDKRRAARAEKRHTRAESKAEHIK